MTKIEEMEEKYLTEKEAVYSFGIKETVTGNSVAGRKRIGEIIALCDVEKLIIDITKMASIKLFICG